MSPIYSDVFLERKLGDRETSSLLPLSTACLFCFNFWLTSATLTRQREVFALFSLILMISIWRPSLDTRQQTAHSWFSFHIFFWVWVVQFGWGRCSQKFLGEVQGFPEFIIHPGKAPVGKLHRSVTGYGSEDTAVLLLLPACSRFPQCDDPVFSLTSPFRSIKGWHEALEPHSEFQHHLLAV